MRTIIAAIAGVTFAMLAGAPKAARATDLYVPPPYAGTYGAPPASARFDPPPIYVAPPPVYVAPPAVVAPRPTVEERCRVRHRVSVDAYGREIVRRIRICDEGVVERYAARPYDPAERFAPPRPPGNVGRDYGGPYAPGYRDPPSYPGYRDDAPPRDWDDAPDDD